MNPFDSDEDELSWQLSYIDFANAFLTCLAALFLIALVDASPNKNEANADRQAQVVITMEWPTDKDCDVDLWVKDPQDATVYYQAQSIGLSHLERDDRGDQNDTTTLADGKVIVVHENKEYWTLRGLLPGTFRSTVHLFRCSVVTMKDGKESTKALDHGTVENMSVKVTLEKVNPTLQLIQTKTIIIPKIWDEEPALMFDLDGAGNVLNVEETDQLLIGNKLDTASGSLSGIPFSGMH